MGKMGNRFASRVWKGGKPIISIMILLSKGDLFLLAKRRRIHMKKLKQRMPALLAIMLLICILCTSGFAANGEPLKLESSNPENNATEVSTDLEQIELKFSKNVVNMKVAENNKTCVDFVDGNGNTVPFELIMADDQVERELRDFLYIKPVTPLQEGTTYIVKISKALTSKSGTALEEDLEVSFTTVGGESTAASNPDSSGFPPALFFAVGAAALIGFVVTKRKRK